MLASLRQPSAPAEVNDVLSSLPHTLIGTTWNVHDAESSSTQMGGFPLNPAHMSFVSPGPEAILLPGVTSTRTPRVNIDSLIPLASNVSTNRPGEVRMEDLQTGPPIFAPELPRFPSNFGAIFPARYSWPSQTLADFIVRNAFSSSWHENPVAAAETVEQINNLAKSYEKAILLMNEPGNLYLNLSYRFWLASAYAYKLGREEEAVSEWRSIAERCSAGVGLNILWVSCLDELANRNKIEDVSLGIYGNATNPNLYRMTVKLIHLGKAMERQNNPGLDAQGVYLKIVRHCLALVDDRPSIILLRCLGKALLALGELEHAQYALGLVVRVILSSMGGGKILEISSPP
jgi:hypothetical protein